MAVGKEKGSAVGLDGVSKLFTGPGEEGVLALQELSVEISAGSFVCFVGPSGCGKTTLLRLLAGLIEPTEGRVLIDGQVVDGPDKRCGMVFQEYSLFPWLTVRENVEFGLRFRGVAREERTRIAGDLLKLAHLRDSERLYPKALSGGMKQRVALMRTLAVGAPILLMDEPFGALDPQVRTMMQEHLLRVWKEHRKTVVFVTHDVDEALYLSDVIYVLTARPARLKAAFESPLERPRRPEVRFGHSFLELKRELVGLLREEIQELV